MQNLAKCKPSEFLRQTNRIRKSAEKWLKDTDIMNIRRRMKPMQKITDGMTAEEKEAVAARNRQTLQQQTADNLRAILDAILDEHPDETLELLALMCFVEPENVDDYPIADYITAINDMLSDEAVMGFFTSLTRLGQMFG